MTSLACLGKDALGIVYAYVDIGIVLRLSRYTREMYRLLLVILKNNYAMRKRVALHICEVDYNEELLEWMLPLMDDKLAVDCYKLACYGNAFVTFRVLLGKCDPNTSVGICWAIKFACRQGARNLVKALLDDPRTKDPKGNGMIICAADQPYTKWGDIGVVTLLMRDRRFINKEKGWHMLTYAIKYKDLVAFKLMLSMNLIVSAEHMKMIYKNEWREGAALLHAMGK